MYRLLEPQPDKRLPLEKMTDDPWFQNAGTGVANESAYEQSFGHSSPAVPLQDADTGKEENAKQYFQEQAAKMGGDKESNEPKTVWSKNKQVHSSSTVRTTPQGEVKNTKSAKKQSNA